MLERINPSPWGSLVEPGVGGVNTAIGDRAKRRRE